MPAHEAAADPARLLAHRHWRTDWTAERTCLYWYLTFDDHPDLHTLFDAIAHRLAAVPAVDAVPAAWLHLTLLEVGFADQVDAAEMADLVAAARDGAARFPLRLDVGPLTTMGDCVVLGVGASAEVVALRHALSAGLASSRGTPTGSEPFTPHVTVAYTNRDCARSEVMAPLADLGDPRLVLHVPRLTLAAVSRLHDHYRWEEVATLPVEATGP